MERQNRKDYFQHIWHDITSQHLVFMKNGGQPHESLFFFFQKLNAKLKNPISIKSYGSAL